MKCFWFFRTITFVIYVCLRFNNMSPKNRNLLSSQSILTQIISSFFSWPYICTFHLLTTTTITLYIPCCFVCANAHTDSPTHAFDGRNHRPQKFESLLQSMSYYRSVSKFYDHQKSIKYFVACVKLCLNDVWWISVLFF